MTADLHWNRLVVATDGDAAFKTAIERELPALFNQPYPELEIDLGQCRNVGEEGFRSIGLKLVEHAGKRRLLVRVTPTLARRFEGSGLSDLVEVHIVERMDGKPRAELPLEESAGEIAPISDEFAARPDEDTIPPSEDPTGTRAQDKATGGLLVDQEDNREIEIGEELVVGREQPSRVVYAIPTISKRHFRIYPQGAAYFIEDMRSTNGTYLNGDPLTQPRPLDDGDEIIVAITLKHPEGARRFKFQIR